MPRPVRPWFRLYVETFGDRKIRRLTPAQRWLWAAILGASRESCEPGALFVAPDMPMSLQELADYAGVPLRDVRTGLEAMGRMSMVTVVGDLVRVTNWDARQFESDDVTRRTRDHRERSKEPPQKRSNGVPANAPERTRAFATETETETETETSGGADEPPVASTQTFIAEWIEHSQQRPPSDIIGQVSKRLKVLVDDGIEPTVIRRGLAEWDRRNLHPSVLPSIVHEAQKAKAQATVTRLPRSDELEQPPSGLSPKEYAAWDADYRARLRERQGR